MSDPDRPPVVRGKPSLGQRLVGALVITGGVIFLLTGAVFGACALAFQSSRSPVPAMAALNWSLAAPAIIVGVLGIALGFWLCLKGPVIQPPQKPPPHG